MKQVAVIGGGQAGLSAAAALRHQGYRGRIALIGDEAVLPYQRPPLSKKYLCGDMNCDRLYLRPATFYADNEIALLLGKTVGAIDPASMTVTIDGATTEYDHIVLATGSRARNLPHSIRGDLENVYCLRDLSDADRLAPELAAGRSVLIVGGGYIGLEVAAVASTKGLNVTLIEREDRILKRVAAQETSDYFRRLHDKNGVRILEGVDLERLSGEVRSDTAHLSDGGSLKIDFVVVGIGVSPCCTLAENANIAVENGIWTDSFGRTSHSNIWAAGDCASFPYRGKRIRLESVPNAIHHAEAVAANIMGAEKEYVATPWFWSDQFDTKLQIAGWNAGYDRVMTRVNNEGSVSFWYFEGMDLLAVDAINAPIDYMVGRRLIEAGVSPLLDDVADPKADLKRLIPK